jgi:hypothetical protein
MRCANDPGTFVRVTNWKYAQTLRSLKNTLAEQKEKFGDLFAKDLSPWRAAKSGDPPGALLGFPRFSFTSINDIERSNL